MKKTEEKTNAVRILTQKKLRFRTHDYTESSAVSAVEVAQVLGQEPQRMFKTLVTEGRSGAHYVFLVPAPAELNLKKGAAVVGEKSIAMLKSKDLLPLTGYIHGGCSPVGMKKHYPTVVDESARPLERMIVSAGRIGGQIELAPGDLQKATGCSFAAVAE